MISSVNSMAESSNANNVPEGTTLVFGSWSCKADGSGGFSSQLITPKASESKTNNQSAEISDTTELGRDQALLELSSDTTENVSTPTRILGSVEFDTNSNFEKLYFSETLGKYVTYLKSIKCPKINNSELLDGVDQVSRSIEGCIKLAESALGSSKSQQNPEASNPPQERSGDILSGVDRVDSTLVDCIKMAEVTLQNKQQKSGGGICGRSGRTNPRLVRMGPSFSRKTQNPSPKTAPNRIPQPAESLLD